MLWKPKGDLEWRLYDALFPEFQLLRFKLLDYSLVFRARFRRTFPSPLFSRFPLKFRENLFKPLLLKSPMLLELACSFQNRDELLLKFLCV